MANGAEASEILREAFAERTLDEWRERPRRLRRPVDGRAGHARGGSRPANRRQRLRPGLRDRGRHRLSNSSPRRCSSTRNRRRRAGRPSSTSTATRSSPTSGSTGTPSSTSRSAASSPDLRCRTTSPGSASAPRSVTSSSTSATSTRSCTSARRIPRRADRQPELRVRSRARSIVCRTSPMRILLVSDLHYTFKQLDWVASVAADYDLVVMAGDHLDIASIVEPDAQIAVVLEYFSRIAAKTTLVVCSGNHDLNARNELGERPRGGSQRRAPRASTSTGRASRTRRELVTVCPWWDGPLTRDSSTVSSPRTRHSSVIGGGSGCTTRRPTHRRRAGPASGTTATPNSSAWIEQYQPRIVLCGHVHQSPFAPDGSWIDRIGSTLVFNAGRQIGPVPTRIELDTETGTARWSSMEGVEERGARPGELVLGVRIAFRAELAAGPALRIRLPSTTSTIPSPPSWSAYWSLRSTRYVVITWSRSARSRASARESRSASMIACASSTTATTERSSRRRRRWPGCRAATTSHRRTCPVRRTTAIGTPAFSMRSAPSSSTTAREPVPVDDKHFPAARDRRGKPPASAALLHRCSIARRRCRLRCRPRERRALASRSWE